MTNLERLIVITRNVQISTVNLNKETLMRYSLQMMNNRRTFGAFGFRIHSTLQLISE